MRHPIAKKIEKLPRPQKATKGEVGRPVAGAAGVLRLDRPDHALTVAGMGEAEEGRAVAVGAAHHLLLQLVPVFSKDT
jgi:hypothetical protein